ncbi:glucokinase [Apiospora kogelbergensis]|uniref:Phosphotransferase n=1 Tax=Apiospora kogelbergensis TaxID=1337665 RepID=A0AAW0QY04_9PEZI
MSLSDGCSSPGLLARAQQIAREFEFSSEDARKVTAHFVGHMRTALEQQESLSQIPSYVRAIPTGKEEGVFLAVDLGGTNCRVCSVELHGDGTYSLVQTKYPIPRPLTVNPSYKPLFQFIAEKIRDFLKDHPDADVKDEGPSTADGAHPPREDFRKLGFTFSFTYEQHSLGKGSVMFWDKGWDIPEALGRDPCAMLQEALDELRVPVLVVALANDSVGTLLTRAYTSPGNAAGRTTVVGAIFGTGTNAAYVERLDNVKHLHGRADDSQHFRRGDECMVINTEWGCFGDGQDGLLPSTEYDEILDADSPHPRHETTEKRISGLYLGELLRLVVLRLVDGKLLGLTLDPESPVFRKEGIESPLLSQIATDNSENMADAVVHLANAFRAEQVSVEDARAIQLIAKAIARRAARLAGVALAAIILQCDQSRDSQSTIPAPSLMSSKSSDVVSVVEHKLTNTSKPSSSSSNKNGFGAMCHRFRVFIYGLARSLGLGWLLKPAMAAKKKRPGAAPTVVVSDEQPPPGPSSLQPTDKQDNDGVVEVGVDGSLIEFYPTFEQEMREAVGDVLGPGHEKRLRIGMAKDGSGVGAALVALAATMQKETPPAKSN